ncbi:MAG: phosphatase PAP2 family protein [Ruminococcus sp.]|nr:phosphatase PAP2 family protein [Ruminococcus sp.]
MLKKIQHLDDLVVKKIAKIHTPFLNRIMIIFTKLGNGAFIWWITLCFPFLLSKKTRSTGVYLTLALGVTFIVGEIIIKHIIGRMRPSSKLDDDELIIKRPKDYSFPSGHTASSFTAFTITMLRCTPAIFIPVLLVALIISFSRMYLRVHYLSDVVCGAALGILSGLLCNIIFENLLGQYFMAIV